MLIMKIMAIQYHSIIITNLLNNNNNYIKDFSITIVITWILILIVIAEWMDIIIIVMVVNCIIIEVWTDGTNSRNTNNYNMNTITY